MKPQKNNGISESAPTSLANFQLSYGCHLRNPSAGSKPANIPSRASEIYEELFFNNICGFINNCFPVAKSFYSADIWQSFCRAFFKEWRCHTPYFTEIPKEFVSYIQSSQQQLDLPPWLAELIEYEWLELEVDISNATALQSTKISHEQNILFTNPTLKNCAFEWPVHRISTDAIPELPQATFLAIYRDDELRVQFMELNAITAALLEIFEQAPCHAQTALRHLATSINHPNPEQLVQFGQTIIADFLSRRILIST